MQKSLHRSTHIYKKTQKSFLAFQKFFLAVFSNYGRIFLVYLYSNNLKT